MPVEKSIEKSAKRSDYDAAFSIPELITGRKVFFAIFLVVIVVSLFSFLGQTVRKKGQSSAEVTLPQIAGKKTIAVMFFENQSKSTEFEWLREGFPDMLITNLSRSTK